MAEPLTTAASDILPATTTVPLLSAHGYHGLNLEGVAEQTEIAKGALYHYFSGKDELVGAVLEALTSDVNSRLEAKRTSCATAASSSSSVPLSARRCASSPRPHPSRHGVLVATRVVARGLRRDRVQVVHAGGGGRLGGLRRGALSSFAGPDPARPGSSRRPARSSTAHSTLQLKETSDGRSKGARYRARRR
ncbi:MAG: helix-turn-helix domain-containing protein [Mycobacterium sp.]|uniref:helix-turn-helix domain-containing protein n=1 Tax=Mycobacterium sp. TaxID=1785 RepID=UPI00389ADADC